MAFKIYVENNHIVVQDLVSDKEFRAASKEALFFKDRVSEDTYNTNGFFPKGLQGIKFSDIVDENETPFVNEQAFIDFFSANTGNFNSAGASAQINYSTDEVDTGINWIDGKPIYRKTKVYLTADLPESLALDLTADFTDVETICPSTSCFIDWTTENGIKGLSGYLSGLFTEIGVGFLNCYTSSFNQFNMNTLDSITLTLYYTKTTD